MREEHVITRQDKRIVLYGGLLAEAHERGLKGIETEPVQIPTADNAHVSISKARVVMEDGSFFDGIGDASPENVARNIAPHIIRMSETRAKARALRDAVNVGDLFFDDEVEASPELAKPPAKAEAAKAASPSKKNAASARRAQETTRGGARPNSATYLFQLEGNGIEDKEELEALKQEILNLSQSEVVQRINQAKASLVKKD